MTFTDDQLKHALRRQEPPAGFADRVLARAAQQTARQDSAAEPARPWWRNFFAQPLLQWATAAALCVALVASGLHYRNAYLEARRERAEGEAAKQQLMLALRIAGSKLQLAKAKVHAVNLDQDPHQQVKE